MDAGATPAGAHHGGDAASGSNLTEWAYYQLLEMILNGELPGRSVIQERRLAERLDVSRSPLRSALDQLYGQGMLERISPRTLAVRSITLDEYLDSLQIRSLLEVEAARCAARSLSREQAQHLRDEVVGLRADSQGPCERHWEVDDNLHQAIAGASGNGMMARQIRELRRYARMYDLRRMPERFLPGCDEHIAILDAILAGDPQAAAQAMQAHLDGIRASMLARTNGA